MHHAVKEDCFFKVPFQTAAWEECSVSRDAFQHMHLVRFMRSFKWEKGIKA